MIVITKTPVRVSLLGGGTDYPAHFLNYGGQTLGFSVNKYCYITVKSYSRSFDHSIRVNYSKTELARSIDEIQHPSVRHCLKHMEIFSNIEVTYSGDLPARSGLGSSSAFTVGLLNGLHAYRGSYVNQYDLAKQAVYVEQELIGEKVGAQDQYTTAHGGMMHLQYSSDGHVRANRVTLTQPQQHELLSHLILLYTGTLRNSQDILDEQLNRTAKGLLTKELCELNQLVNDGLKVISAGNSIADLGRLLHEAWSIKKTLSTSISNNRIDEAYDTAKKYGAIGGKLLGAGGGGFMLLLAEPHKHQAITKALGLLRVPIDMDFSGSQVVFYDPNPLV